jgi:type VI secretion system secreted protein VgrG
MLMPLTQETRSLKLKSPLGEDVLLLIGVKGQEELSRLFRFELELLSTDDNVKATDVVGKNVTFSINLADGSPRFFNGFVSQFGSGEEHEGRRTYRAEVVPWLWFLSQTSDCRIFQNKTVPQIIEQLFGDLSFSDYEINLQQQHPPREYCVQYRESDFDFASRLMEEEGIFYYFRHEDGKHVLVLADHKGAYFDCKENSVDYPTDWGSRSLRDHLTSWVHEFSFRPGRWAQTDYNFTTPSTSLMSQSKTVLKVPGLDKYEVYDYPGTFPDKGVGGALTKLRMEEVESAHDIVQASSLCKTFTPGGRFTIGSHPSSDEEGKSYVVRSINHEAHEIMSYEAGAAAPFEYSNKFTCIPDTVVFRAPRKTTKPVVHGVQTAVVVGPAGEEIYTDEFGRVKVQFHWDREGKKDENSSCWVRVSQIHAGNGFGSMNLPRMGEEVILSFLEGNPDRPIITGRVYHKESMPPYGLPDSKIICGMKSKTYKGSGYNEYCMDDTPGKELIREHGQYDKDSTIEHDLREHVLNNRSRDVSVNETVSIGSNQSISVGADRKVDVGGKQTITVGGNHSESIGANHELTISAQQSTSISSSQKIVVGADRTTSINANDQLNVSSKLTIGAGGDIEISSDSKITLTVGGSSITIEDAKISIKSTTVLIEGDAKVETKAAQIVSQATGNQEITGALVKIN